MKSDAELPKAWLSVEGRLQLRTNLQSLEEFHHCLGSRHFRKSIKSPAGHKAKGTVTLVTTYNKIIVFWASLVAHMVKNLPTVQETWVQSLDLEDPLEKGKVTTPVFLPGEFHGLYSPRGRKESDVTGQLSLTKIVLKSHYMNTTTHSQWQQRTLISRVTAL